MKLAKLSIGAALIGAALTAPTTPLSAETIVNGYDLGYDVVIFNSFTANNSESSVPIAIAGNATTTNFSFEQTVNSAVPGNYGTVVAGNLTMTGGAGPSPSTYVAGAATLTNTTGCGMGCVQTGGSSPVNFGLLQNEALNESSYLSGLAASGTAALKNGGLIFTAGAPNQSLYIFSINESQLTSGYTYMDFVGTGNATVIVNVTGSIAAGSSLVNSSLEGTSGSNVLFNFYNASQITVSGFDASVLAPFATVYGDSGQFDGSLMAENFTGGTSTSEFNDNDAFNGTVPIDPALGAPPAGSVPTPLPEPGTAYLVTGAILVAAGTVRFKRRLAIEALDQTPVQR